MSSRTLFLALLLPAALVGSGCEIGISAGGLEGTFDRDLSVTGSVDLDVRSGSGNIDVRTGPAGTVHVHGLAKVNSGPRIDFGGESAADHVHRLETNPPIEQSGNTIRVGERGPRFGWSGVTINYVITVPAGTQVKAGSGSGDLMVDAVAGPVSASTGSGNIHIGRITADVQAASGSGDIEVSGARTLVAHTGSGNVRARAVNGDVEAQSGSGDISVAQGAPGQMEIDTGSGNITVAGARAGVRAHSSSGDVSVEGAPTEDWDVRASSGTVRVRVPAEAHFDLEAHTSSGRINSTLPVSTTGDLSRHDLRGQVGGGGPRVRLSTSSGDVEIR